MTPRATIDFETRSACKIRDAGSWRYACDPTTEVLVLAFRLPHWEKGRTAIWHPAHANIGLPEMFDMDEMAELVEWIEAGGLVEAHNAWFERGIWAQFMVPVYGFPAILWHQWRCSAAKAAAHALPRGLEDVAVILGCDEQKDAEGSKLLKKLSKPRKARKAEKEEAEESGVPLPVLWFESVEMFYRLCDYCRQDVLTEEAVSEKLDDLDATDTRVYLADQLMNERGFRLDSDAIDAALVLIDGETAKLNAELAVVTNGYVEKATERENLQTWLASEGLVLPNMQKLTIDDTLQRPDVQGKVRRALEIKQELGRSSTAKYQKMRAWQCPDERAHGGLLFHGASTGRWAGAGIQPQNFPKGKIKDMDAVWDLILTRDVAAIQAKYPNIMELLSWALRGAIVPTRGKWLYVADYASIEARVLPWLAGDEETIAMFRTGADIYCEMASDIYGYPCTKEDNPSERALGKVAILGLGYQMGWSKFIDSCWTMARIEIDAELSQRTVNAYRERFWRTVELWRDTELAAIEAVETGKPITVGKVTYAMTEGDEDEEYQFLYCTLPSGRRIAYPDPYVRPKRMPWGELKPALSFMGVDQKTHQWVRQDTYGGMLVENIDQAVSRDLMAAAILRCEDSDTYTPILTVHDELIAEADLDTGDVKEFEHLVAECPKWAAGIPVAAEGWRGLRYRK